MPIITKLLFLAALVGVLYLGGSALLKPDIIWQTQQLEVTIIQGGRVSADISFLVNKDLQEVSLWVVPEIEEYVILVPNYFDQIRAGSVVKPQAIFIVPDDLEPGTYDGTIHVKIGPKTFARPLPVIINVIEKPPPLPPGQIELFNDDGTAEAFDFDPYYGRAGSFAKFDIAGYTVKILYAKIYLKVVKEPADPIDIYVWDFDRTRLLPLPHRVAPTGIEEDWFLVDLSLYNLVVSDEFYLGIAWPSAENPPLLGVDLTDPQGKSYVVILEDDTFISVINANFMIRAIVEKL